MPSARPPALPGDPVSAIRTPALIVDLDAFEANIARMRAFVQDSGLRLRAHAKTHKSADIARIQMRDGGACGVCCQKVSEAEALVEAGVTDILVSNEITGTARAEALARLAERARIGVCVDSLEGVAELAAATAHHDTELSVLVEVDVGAGRCGVAPGAAAVPLARAIAAAPGLIFGGLQAYQGSLQHIADPAARAAAAKAAAQATRDTLKALHAEGFDCATVGGAGTGSFRLDSGLGQVNELQCGSYIFMDADYDRIEEIGGGRPGGMENALFILTEVMSTAVPGKAVCDAGLKAMSLDSGLPRLDAEGLSYLVASDEHGEIADPDDRLARGDRLRLVPGHCDPTCNLYDHYVAVRGDTVEAIWPVTARGCLW
ncbi:alanine racemase [Pseudooceanicola sp. CBS1P-1]|uniref:DSD1 family PLP-dependent enzyme n=1 Tax=Pseudooceanicola albus TaxID=2692189 RepID=A0A6L7G4M6_9RHOB|nr:MULTISPECIES: DSD1 family PLP-dependent enzyme [Pseudooceanicola]MBT9385342.1 alanine racemase [Pseudooceanicola endophyticus]MXN18799.1 DSD1 family PLP-dependent enzyme [Pseudooceanicola albus]